MRYFDLHCDTLTNCYKQHEGLKNNNQHISFEKSPAQVYIQCCACWIQETIKKEKLSVRFWGKVLKIFAPLM